MKNTPENAELLASRWLTTEQLVTLEKEAGLIYKKGQFSPTEHQSIIAAIESYREVSMTSMIYSNLIVFHSSGLA